MVSLIRTRLNHRYATRRQFRQKNLWVQLQDENLPTCTPSGLEPLTYHILQLGTLHKRSNQLGHQGRYYFVIDIRHTGICLYIIYAPEWLLPYCDNRGQHFHSADHSLLLSLTCIFKCQSCPPIMICTDIRLFKISRRYFVNCM